jgi:hypothetical protein
VARFQRFRWTALGIVIGVVLTVGAIVVGSIITPDSSDADLDDAGRIADAWATDNKRSGERYAGRDCGTDGWYPAYRFACWVRFEPTGRRFTLYMRTAAPDGDYEVVLAQVRKGRHPLPFP